VTALLKTVGIAAESDRLDTLIANLKGKQLHELVSAGQSKLSTISGKLAVTFQFTYQFFVM
jgi:large subunit ribosomal protein LP2